MRLRTAVLCAVCATTVGGGLAYAVFATAERNALEPAARVAVRAHHPSFATAGAASAAGPGGYRSPSAGRRIPEQRETGLSAALPRQRDGAAAAAAWNIVDNEIIAANLPPGFERVLQPLGLRLKASHALSTLGFTLYRLGPAAGGDLAIAHRALRRTFPGALIDLNHAFDLAAKDGPAATMTAAAPAAASAFPSSYARTLIGWRDVDETCGGGIRVGMIDTHVAVDHPALDGLNVVRRSFVSTNAPVGAEHGTAIAAMLIGRPIEAKGWGGLLPKAELFAANIFSETADGNVRGSASAFVEAIDWLAGVDVHVVNLSLAGPANRVVGFSIDRARRHGLAMVAAAGNDGSEAGPAYPAGYPAVIAVTAIDADRNIYPYANRGRYIDFAAPGVKVWTAIPGGGRYQSGTSFATPFVSALVAIDVAHGGLKPRAQSIRQELKRDAIDLGQPGHDTTFGWGLIGASPRCTG